MPSGVPSRIAILIAVAALGCDPPEAPDLFPTAPPPPAANDCVPPYARFANAPFLWVDLDRGASCTVFLEQDECVLGLFRDGCGGDEREWRGAIDGEDRIRLQALYPPGNGALLPRAPRCCDGLLIRSADDPPWAQLTCQTRSCGASSDADHLGLALERSESTPDRLRLVSEVRLPGPIVDGEGLYALVSGGGSEVDGVWSLEDAPRRVRTILDGQQLAEGGVRVWVATGARVDGGDVSIPLEGALSGLVGTSEGIAFIRDTTLVHYRPDAPGGGVVHTSTRTESPLGLAADREEGRIYLLTRSHLVTLDPQLQIVDRQTLELPFFRTPRAQGEVAEGRVWIVAACHEADLRERCVWSIETSSGAVRRVSIPDVEQIGAPTRAGDQWWIPDASGALHLVDAETLRPLLSSPFSVPGPAAFVSPMDGVGRHRVLERAGPRVWTVEAAGGRG